MNRRMVLYTVGQIVLLEAILLLLPLVVSLLYGESTWVWFLAAAGICLICGAIPLCFARPKTRVIYAREGFAITTLAWIAVSVLGAFPFFLSGQIPNFIDAFFETVSGFTTTGASILKDVEALDRGLLFWRSFTHWIGGMGVLVFLMAILSGISDRSIHIIRAEMPGPTVGKLLPRTKDTAKVLYLIYLLLSGLQTLLLLCSGMNLFDSVVHMFGSAGTGGFGIYADSMASATPAQQWIVAVFVLLFGINFNLFYLIMIRRFRTAFRSTELWFYLGIVALATAILCLDLREHFSSLEELLRQSFFQVSSVITTTGYTTLDFNTLPSLSKTVVTLLMFAGACAGSTGGGFKLARVILLWKSLMAELRRMLHPRSVNILRFEGRRVEEETRGNVLVYFAAYVFCFLAILFLLSLNGFSFETTFSAAASCFNNIGPAFGSAFAGYFDFSPFSKILLSLAMLLGRLEIWPILLTLLPLPKAHRS